MKKTVIFLFALLAVTVFTACNKSDEPENRQVVNMTVNNRAIDGDQVVFSQGNAKVELNYSDMLIKFTADYKDTDGISHTITTPDMKMTPISSSVYEFRTNFDNQLGGTTGESFAGYIDMNTGVTWYTIHSGSMEVICTTHLLYAYATTTMTNPDNGNHSSHERSAYLFYLDSKGETCIMSISNFISTLNGSVDAAEVQYKDLDITVTPTTTGYIVTADEVESNYKGYYTLTDVHFVLNDQCQVIEGSFKCNDLEYTVSGTLFPAN